MAPRRSIILAGLAIFAAWPALGQDLPASQLIAALRQGGYVVIMRHAHAPADPPGKADPDNAAGERQLDAGGREAALALGAALKSLHIPVGRVWSSPTYRARQTAALAGLANPDVSSSLGDGGVSMQPVTSPPFVAFLKVGALTEPSAGTDTFMVTQQPNMVAAFGEAASTLQDGEALVFKPNGKLDPNPVGRLRISDWTAAAAVRPGPAPP